MDYDMSANVAAFEQTVRSTIALAETLAAGDWELPTECPGWSVRDQVSHLVGIERRLLGESDPEHPLSDNLPHIRNDFGRVLEVAVDLRRSVPGPKVLDELREALELRLAALPDIDPEQRVALPNGRMGSYAELMLFRAFDCWTHEQDIRRAVRRPGNLDAPAADCARTILTRALPLVVAKRAGASPGQSVALHVSEPVTFAMYVVVGDDGRGRLADRESAAEPTTGLWMDWETYTRLACGRVQPDSVDVAVSGDVDLGRRVLCALAITP